MDTAPRARPRAARVGKGLGACALLALACLALSGCLGYGDNTLKVDWASGKLEWDFHDITSDGLAMNGSKDPVQDDWASLKDIAAHPGAKGTLPKGLKDARVELYQEGAVLSGKLTCRFENASAPLGERLKALSELVDGSFSESNGLIILVTKEKSEDLLSSDGQILRIPKEPAVVAWPSGVPHLEVAFGRVSKAGQSLLPYYLKERRGPPAVGHPSGRR